MAMVTLKHLTMVFIMRMISILLAMTALYLTGIAWAGIAAGLVGPIVAAMLAVRYMNAHVAG